MEDALAEAGFETIMVNCNPETVSTDYDTADRLYFEPLTFEDVMAVIERERDGNVDVSCVVQFGGQTAINLAESLSNAGVKILGTQVADLDRAEDRDLFEKALKDYKSKIIKTRQLSQLVNRTEFVKKSVKKRQSLQKAIYVQKKFGK